MKSDRPEQPSPPVILALMLLVSGGCALTFQVVWIRELHLIFGATTASSATVLAVFMAGLGIGNWLFGRRIDSSLHPLRFYAGLESGIALSAGVSPWLIDLVRTLYIGVGGQATLGSELAMLLRIGSSVVILAIPTVLMGGTMPAAARAVSIDSDVKRRGVALIYGLNTLGAVIGAGMANFVFLETLGNRAVLWFACVINISLACYALHLSRRLTRLPKPKADRRKKESPELTPNEVESHSIGLVCVSSAIVGFAFFLMEIVWYRMLGPLLGGTTYTFGLILCIALFGIGVGGALYSLLGRWLKPSLTLLAITCAVEALLIGIPFWYGDQIAMWVLQQRNEPISTFADVVWNWTQVGAFVILPASLVAGFQFPVLIATAGSGRENIGKHVGWTFAANTLGAISGSLAGGFILLPRMTAPGVWKLAVGLLVAWGVLLSLKGLRGKKFSLALTGCIAALALLTLGATGPTAVWRHSGIGAGRVDPPAAGRNAEQDLLHELRRCCLWEAEGRESSVAIVALDGLSFIVNGKSDGNAYGDAGTQIGLGLLGTLLHRAPQTGLVIGLGTGESAGWMADVDGITSVDVVELEPVVAQMAERCATVNRNALNNPKLHLHMNDAREYLLTVEKQYDLIVSEPSNPYRAGIANLYTQEFYQSAAQRLTEDGLFLQWLQGYEVDERTVRIVMRTIRSVFPHVQIWQTKSRDLVFVCGLLDSSLSFDADSLGRRFQLKSLREGLRLGWRVSDLEGIAAHYVCGNRTIDKMIIDGTPWLNTDDRNLLEYAFAKTMGSTTRFAVPALFARAIEHQDDFPLSLTRLDRETVTRRRLAVQLYHGGAISIIDNLSEEQRLRAEAYQLYLDNQYSEAAERFKNIEVDRTCAIELMVYAHTLAETGLSVTDELMQELFRHNETEAHAILAIARFQRRDYAAALEEFVLTFEQLKTDSWASTQLLFSVLRKAGRLSELEPTAASKLEQQLNVPFAMHRLDDKRRVVRYFVSRQLTSDRIVPAIEDLEPFVPWKGWFLEHRAEVYAAEQHPFAARALNDLNRFQAWE